MEASLHYKATLSTPVQQMIPACRSSWSSDGRA